MVKKIITGVVLVFPLLKTTAHAYDVNDKFSVGGVLAVTVQCQNVSDAPGFSNTCETAAPFQPEFSFRPTPVDEVFFKLGFAAGKGINGKSPFEIPPWAADLEENVRNINGRERDYLLTAWYKRTFQLADSHRLGASFGIIDATDYLDKNAYANDEYTQFLNPALTNGPNVFLPSYDVGAALEWDDGPWSLRAVLMEVGENIDGNSFLFYGVQAGYAVQNALGTGNYRLVLAGASRDFLNPEGTQLENRAGALLSFDQAFGAVVGGWLRVGWQTEDAAVNYHAIFSGGWTSRVPAGDARLTTSAWVMLTCTAAI
jgi:porin